MTADAIVEALLMDDLGSKLPLLVKQYPQLGQERIMVVAKEADPTMPSADYINWLAKMLAENGMEFGELPAVRELLTRFHKVKKAKDFQAVLPEHTGKPDAHRNIMNYKNVAALRDTLDAEANKAAGTKKQKADTGVKVLTTHGDLTCSLIQNVQAAKTEAIGHGTNGSPETQWCVRNTENGASYLAAGKLFVVTRGQAKYVLVFIRSGTDTSTFGPGEAKDTDDGSIGQDLANEIAPLFVNDKFAALFDSCGADYQPSGKSVGSSEISNNVRATKARFYTEMRSGKLANGTTIKPLSREEADAAWVKKLPAFFNYLLSVVRDPNHPAYDRMARQHSEASDFQALFNAVYIARRKDVTLPDCLASLENFIRFERKETENLALK